MNEADKGACNEDWKPRVDDVLQQALSREDLLLLQRSFPEANAELRAKLLALHLESQLDAIGLQATPKELTAKLYEIAEAPKSKPAKVFYLKPRYRWSLLAAAAVLLLMMATGLNERVFQSSPQPSAAEIAQAEAELNLTLHFLRKATAISRAHVRESLGAMQTASEAIEEDTTSKREL